MITGPKELHDQDWQGWKKDNVFIAQTSRFMIICRIAISSQPKMILDMGCGSGFLASLIKKLNPEIIVHGFDVSGSALAKAEHLDSKFLLDLDKQDVPLPDENYDVIVCSEVLEHIYDVDHALGQMRRLLKKNGLGIITVPNLAFWRFRLCSLRGHLPSIVRDPRHLHSFNLALLKEKSQQAGLKVLKVVGCRTRFNFLDRISTALFSDTIILLVKKPKD